MTKSLIECWGNYLYAGTGKFKTHAVVEDALYSVCGVGISGGQWEMTDRKSPTCKRCEKYLRDNETFITEDASHLYWYSPL